MHRNTINSVCCDAQVHNLSVRAKGKLLLENTQCTITAGRRYGLVGPNGKGKSTLLRLIARRQIPVPEALDVLLVEQVTSPAPMFTAGTYTLCCTCVFDEVLRLLSSASDSEQHFLECKACSVLRGADKHHNLYAMPVTCTGLCLPQEGLPD